MVPPAPTARNHPAALPTDAAQTSPAGRSPTIPPDPPSCPAGREPPELRVLHRLSARVTVPEAPPLEQAPCTADTTSVLQTVLRDFLVLIPSWVTTHPG